MSKDMLRILSWNIQWGRGIDGRVDLGRTASVIADCDADVVCLQEVAVNHPNLPGAAAEDQPGHLARMLRGYEPIYGCGSDLTDGAGGRRLFGELVMARLPVLQVFRHLLPWPVDAAVPSMQRVAVEAVIAVPELPGGALRVITTHLEYYSAVQRAAQVGALLDICANGYRHAVAPRSSAESDPPFAVLPRGEGVVLCGDFNFAAGAPEHRRLQERHENDVPCLVDAWSVAHPGVANAPTAGVHVATFTTGAACYDFFFVSENLRHVVGDVAVNAATDASDHKPIILEIALA